MRIIYILSSGHSGSTVLGALLGNIKKSLHLGEFINFYKVYSGQLETCSCGELPSECPFWSEIIKRFSKFLKSNNKTIEDYETIRKIVENTILKNETEIYALDLYEEYTKKLFSIIEEVSGKKILIDSSKSPGRAYALSKIFNDHITIILLKRKYSGVIESYQRKREKLSMIKLLISLVKEHCKFVFVINKCNCKTKRINYEDIFSQEKTDEFARKTKIQKSIELRHKIFNKHVIAGNRLRYQPYFYLKRNENHKSFYNLKEKFLIEIAEISRKII